MTRYELLRKVTRQELEDYRESQAAREAAAFELEQAAIPPGVQASSSVPVLPIDSVTFEPITVEVTVEGGDPEVPTYTLPDGRMVTMPEFRELSVSDLEPLPVREVMDINGEFIRYEATKGDTEDAG